MRLLSLLALTAIASYLPGADLPITAVELAKGLASPLWVGSAPGDASRLFTCEQRTGLIRALDATSGALAPTPYLAVAGVLSKDNEQGLLGMAFHPQFATNGRFFVYLTAPGGGKAGHVEIREYHGKPGAEQADPEVVRVVLSFDQPEGNHNGGWISFGPDGKLYLGVGDGGGAGDRHGAAGNGQNRNNLLGKILRLDIDAPAPYIPNDNPYVGTTGKRGEIWAYGLRNPWRCSFDRKTGDLWIGDVGQNTREEIDVIPVGSKGLNFGWRPREGTIATPGVKDETPVETAIEPIIDYAHDQGYSVTGGYVYRGKAIPEMTGWYVYGDFALNRIWAIRPNVDQGQVTEKREITRTLDANKQLKGISSFGEDANGELLICSWKDGRILRIVRK